MKTLNSDEKLSELLKSLPKVNAPANFEYKLMLRMAATEDNLVVDSRLCRVSRFRSLKFLTGAASVALIAVIGIMSISYMRSDMSGNIMMGTASYIPAASSSSKSDSPTPTEAGASSFINPNIIQKSRSVGGGSANFTDENTLRFYNPTKGRIIKANTTKTIIGAEDNKSDEMLAAVSGAI